MSILSFESDDRGARVPCLVANFSERPAIDGVGQLRSKGFNVKLVYSTANLFVRSESNSERAVLDARILLQHINHSHDLGYPRFIIRAKKCGAVGGDDIVTDPI